MSIFLIEFAQLIIRYPYFSPISTDNFLLSFIISVPREQIGWEVLDYFSANEKEV